MRALLVLAFVGCGPALGPHSTTLQAPASAKWTSATVITHHSTLDVHNSMIGGTTTHDVVDVELVVHHANGEGHSLDLVSDYHGAFGIEMLPRDLARREFQLAASPDGTWLVVSADHGATWLLVDPDAMVMCRHLGLRGRPETFWSRLPAGRALALDLVAAANGARGTLGIDHAQDDHELKQARDWVAEHGNEPGLMPVLAATVLARPDNIDVDSAALEVVHAHMSDPEVRGKVRAALEHPVEGRLSGAAIATYLLWDVPDLQLQAPLASWIAQAVAPGGPKIFEYDAVAGGDWNFTRSVWNLARLVEREHAVAPQAEQAAIAVIERMSKMLPDAEERAASARLGTRRVWSIRSSAAEAAVVYAIQILVASHTPAARHAIETAEFDRTGPPKPVWVHYADPLKDYNTVEEGADDDAWFRWALGKLADVPSTR